jgi:predicted MPP superfamily phosphohydrolase
MERTPVSRGSPSAAPDRRAFLKSLVGLGAGTVTGFAAYGYGVARHRTEVSRTELPLAMLPPQLDGLRVALLTDLHRSATVAREDIEHAVGLARAERPDLVVLGGDYVTWGDRTYVEDAAETLARLDAPHGVFAVLGNHDDDRDMPAALSRSGIAVLRDARTAVPVGDASLELVGIRFWTRKSAAIAGLLRGTAGFPILVAHDPRRLTEAAELDIPLVLSGHTHGGQVVLPGVGTVAARKFPVIAGVGQLRHTTIFVSRGIGTVYAPVRLNCPPEVSLLTLHSQK